MSWRRYVPAPMLNLALTPVELARYLWRELEKISRATTIDDLWDDNTADLSTGKVAAGSPTLTALNGGPYEAYVFAAGDSVNVAFHVKHDVVRNSKFYPHIHWTTDTSATGSISWLLSYQIAAGYNQSAFPTASTMRLNTRVPIDSPWGHHITECSDAAAIDMPEVDSLVLMNVELDARNELSNGQKVFGLYVDLHYQKDREGTRYRNTPFYGEED